MIKPRFCFMIGFIVLLTACANEVREEVYKRPEWLRGTLYTQLSDDPNHQMYVKALEITGYKEKLSRSGSFTVFPPTNEAFSLFLQPYGGALEGVPKELLTQIVEYTIIDFPLTRDLLTTHSQWGFWSKNDHFAFKRPSQLKYPFALVDQKRVISERKYLPLFTKQYFESIGLGGKEKEVYEYLFPNDQWNRSGEQAHVMNASIVAVNKSAENGIYHSVDRVVLPLNNIAEMLSSDHNAVEFYTLFLPFRRFDKDDAIKQSLNSSEDLYRMSYRGSRPVELGVPIDQLDADIQLEKLRAGYSDQAVMYSSHTIFVPSNSKIREHLAKYDHEPTFVALRHLLGNHIIKEIVQYPPQLSKEGSPHKHLFDNGKVIRGEMSSNGMIYYINELLEPRVFTSVTAPILYKKEYNKMMYALEKADQLVNLADGITPYYLFAFNDATFASMGIDYDPSTDTFTKKGVRWNNGGSATVTSKDSVKYLVERHIARPIGAKYAKTLAGDYIKVDVQQKEILTDGKVLPIKEVLVAANGLGALVRLEATLPQQQNNFSYLTARFAKFKKLIELTGMPTVYDGTTVFAIPDALITYGVAPFDMLTTAGALNAAMPDALQRLQKLVYYHLVEAALFTDNEELTTKDHLFGKMKTKSGYELDFQKNGVIDAKGNAIQLTEKNITKSAGVILHVVDKVMSYN